MVPLFSMHSISKGFYGECGHRGGYLEVRNPPKVQDRDIDFVDLLTKQASVSLCANTAGQLLTYLMVTPPVEGSGSYQQFIQEKVRCWLFRFRANQDKGAAQSTAGRGSCGLAAVIRLGSSSSNQSISPLTQRLSHQVFQLPGLVPAKCQSGLIISFDHQIRSIQDLG